MKGSSLVLVVAGALLLSSCYHLPRKGLPSEKSGASFALAYDRLLKIEPCGCPGGPDGGIHRELNILRGWEKEGLLWGPLVPLTAGTSFAPSYRTRVLSTKDRAERAKDLVFALNRLGTRAVGLTADDTILGISELESLQKEARFPFLNLNLERKDGKGPLFTQYLELSEFEPPFLVTSLSAESAIKSQRAALPVRVKDPADSLRALLNSLPPKERLLVVLTNLPREEWQALHKKVPEIVFTLGGPASSDFGNNVEQPSPTQFRILSMGEGNRIMRVDVELGRGSRSLYSPQMGELQKQHIKNYQESIRFLQKKLEHEKAQKERARMTAEVARLTGEISKVESLLNLEKTADVRQVRIGDFEVDPRNDSPKNELTDLVLKQPIKFPQLSEH